MPYRGPPFIAKLPIPSAVSTSEAMMNGHFLPRKSKFVFLNNSMNSIFPASDRVRHRYSRAGSHTRGETLNHHTAIRNGSSRCAETKPADATAQLLSVVSWRLPEVSQSKMNFDTNTAVHTLATRPITRLTAKPFTGPVPNRNRKRQDTTVVTCVSIMV